MILYRQLRVNKLVFVRRQKMTEREMQDAATSFLKRNGCGWDARNLIPNRPGSNVRR